MKPEKATQQEKWSNLLLLFISVMMIVVAYSLPPGPNAPHRIYAQDDTPAYSKYDRMDLAMEQEWEKTHDPQTGEIPREKLWAVLEQARRTQDSRAAIPNVKWRERGPSNVGGRTRAVMFDPNDPSNKAAFAGAVGGGLWKTTNIHAQEPDWQPIDDLFPNLAVTTITYEPDNPQTMYFGTGEGWFNSDAIRGDGIWKSTDGGATWSQLGATTMHEFYFVQKLAVDSVGNLLAATRSKYCNTGGIHRSTDGGSTWTQVLSGNGPACGGSSQYERGADIEVSANGDIYASMGIDYTDGLYKSTDNGATWSKITGGGFPNSGFGRIEVACAPSDPNTVIAVLQDASSSDCYGIYLSSDAGATWSSKPVPSAYNFGAEDFTRGQAWYDLIVGFDPNNASRIFLGGIDLHLSEDGGDSWTQITQWYGAGGFQYMHADQHTIQFLGGSSDTVLFGNDGGVYLSTNASNSTPTVEFKNHNYNTVQFYSCAIHPSDGKNYFLAGAQDNGSHRFNHVGPEKAVEVTGGDGSYCAIDQDDAEFQFTSYVYNQYRKSSDSGYTFSNADFSGTEGKFINPWDYDNDANKLYASYESGNYLLWDNPHDPPPNTSYNISAGFSSQASAVTCDPHVSNKVWFGTDDGNVYAVTNAANTSSPTVSIVTGSSFPSAYVSCIAISPTNQDHVVVSFSNYGVTSVWETTDGGGNWQAIEGNLPDMPVRWALFNPNNTDQMMLATEVGVWSTDNINGSSTNWAATNTGMANVRTDMLQYRESDNQVIAATHGRGIYTTDAFTTEQADFGIEHRVAYIGEPVQFYDDSYQANSWQWDFGDGNSSSSQDPQHTYSSAGKYTVSLEINGGPSAQTKTDYIHILPDRPTPYTPSDGGDFEVNVDDFGANNREGFGFSRDNSSVPGKDGVISGSHAWVIAPNSINYKNTTVASLRTPQFNFSSSGNYALKFYAKYDTEEYFDGFRVEYSIDQGASWHTLGSLGSPYDTDTAVSAFSGGPFLSGSNGFYMPYNIDATTLAGNPNVAFRFLFRSDQYESEPGIAIDNFEIEAPVNLLPIDEVLTFDANAREDHALIHWQLDIREPLDHVRLEKSVDGSQFKPLQTYHSTIQQNFNHRDYEVDNGTYYYRLRLEYEDGEIKYSDIEQATFEDFTSFTVAPNPATDFIRHQIGANTEYTLSIYDGAGRLVHQQTATAASLNIPVENWDSGIYFSRLELENGSTLTKKWVKQ